MDSLELIIDWYFGLLGMFGVHFLILSPLLLMLSLGGVFQTYRFKKWENHTEGEVSLRRFNELDRMNLILDLDH